MWLFKTCSEKVSLPFNEVCKQLRVLNNYWERAFCFPASFLSGLNPLWAFPAPCCQEETAKDTKAMIIPRGGKYKFNGDFSFVRSCWFIDEGRQGELIEGTHVIFQVSITLLQPPSIPLSLCLVKKGGTVAFVWLTCLTKVTAAHGRMWMSGPAPLPLCTSVRAGAGRAGWKETNWTQKEGHSPSPDPPLALRPSIPFRCSAGPSSACWLIPFSLPL